MPAERWRGDPLEMRFDRWVLRVNVVRAEQQPRVRDHAIKSTIKRSLHAYLISLGPPCHDEIRNLDGRR